MFLFRTTSELNMNWLYSFSIDFSILHFSIWYLCDCFFQYNHYFVQHGLLIKCPREHMFLSNKIHVRSLKHPRDMGHQVSLKYHIEHKSRLKYANEVQFIPFNIHEMLQMLQHEKTRAPIESYFKAKRHETVIWHGWWRWTIELLFDHVDQYVKEPNFTEETLDPG